MMMWLLVWKDNLQQLPPQRSLGKWAVLSRQGSLTCFSSHCWSFRFGWRTLDRQCMVDKEMNMPKCFKRSRTSQLIGGFFMYPKLCTEPSLCQCQCPDVFFFVLYARKLNEPKPWHTMHIKLNSENERNQESNGSHCEDSVQSNFPARTKRTTARATCQPAWTERTKRATMSTNPLYILESDLQNAMIHAESSLSEARLHKAAHWSTERFEGIKHKPGIEI